MNSRALPRCLLEPAALCESAPMWSIDTGGTARACLGRGGCALLLALSLGQGASSAAVQVPDEPSAAPTRDLEQVESRLQALTEALAARQAERLSISDDLERSERAIADLARARHELGVLLDEQRLIAEDAQTRLSADRQRLERESDGLARLVRLAYIAGRGGGLRLLLDGSDIRRADRVMAYYGYLNRERRRRIEAVVEQTLALERRAREADEESQRLARLVATQDEMRHRLQEAHEARATRLAELEQGIAAGQADAAALAKDAQVLRRVIEQIARQAEIAAEADLQPVPLAQRRGKLAWPLASITMLAQFSAPRGPDGQPLDGVVLAADEGAEVRALYHGRVVYADWLRGFGLLTVIDHGDGYLSLYGNNQTLLKEVGEWVQTGDVVALSGSSGGQQSAQLYFAIRHRGEPQDPRVWCTTAQGAG